MTMWAIVNKDNNLVTEVLQSAKAVIIDNIQHSKDIFKVWNWKLSISPKDAIAKGMKGKDIGDYIKDKESELFTSS